MRIQINPRLRRRAVTLVVACIFAFMVIVIGITVITILLKLCRSLPPLPGSGGGTNQPPDIAATFTVLGAEAVPPAQAAAMIEAARAAGPCGLQVSGLAMPPEIPVGTEITIERSTNLIDWDPIASTVWDGASAAPICDPDPPKWRAFYRAVAR